MRNLAVGSPAPPFDLDAIDPNGLQVRIRSAYYVGRWIALLFYPRDFSFVCPTELTSFSAEKAQFDKRNCELLGISIDTLETHAAWLKTPTDDGGVQGLRFPLATDRNGSVCNAYGLWREDSGLPNRGMFLIDPDGLLRYSVAYDLAVGRNVDDTIRVLDALQAGGLCPANWKRADGVLDVASLLKPGRVLGHYKIKSELGHGAFGRVLAAEDMRLQREVALKIVETQSDVGESELLEEARAAAAVNHPNVCIIHAVEVIDTLPTVVMEYIRGRTLSEWIQNGIALNDFPKFAGRLASGLAAAHESDVVHGDLKPANILVRESLDPVIVDFGLAKSIGASRIRTTATASVSRPLADKTAVDTQWLAGFSETNLAVTIDHTRESDGRPGNGVSGTPAYMAPEQFHGEDASKASDVFSLGLIYCEMILGELPTRNLSLVEIFRSVRDRDFLASMTAGIPEHLQQLVGEMLALEPNDRLPAAEVAIKLSSLHD